MIAHIKGQVEYIAVDAIVIDNQGLGYEVFVAKPYEYHIGEAVYLYTYHHLKEDINALYGFNTREEKDCYMKLLSVKGVGPKLALTVLAATQLDNLLQAIEREDVNYLRKIPGIGPKAAGQIIFDLKGKLVSTAATIVAPELQDAMDALSALGYTKKEIKFALKDIEPRDKKVEEIVKLALINLMG